MKETTAEQVREDLSKLSNSVTNYVFTKIRPLAKKIVDVQEIWLGRSETGLDIQFDGRSYVEFPYELAQECWNILFEMRLFTHIICAVEPSGFCFVIGDARPQRDATSYFYLPKEEGAFLI